LPSPALGVVKVGGFVELPTGVGLLEGAALGAVVGVLDEGVLDLFDLGEPVPGVVGEVQVGVPLVWFGDAGHVAAAVVGDVRTAAGDLGDFVGGVVRAGLVEVPGAVAVDVLLVS
jgi:hypothetical protein